MFSHLHEEGLEKQAAEIERLTKQRDELIDKNLAWLNGWNDQQKQIERLTQQRDELVEALRAVKEQRIDGHMFPAVVDMNAWHTKVVNALAKWEGK